MNRSEIIAENSKMVKRYLKPLLYSLNAIYINAEFVTTSKGKEYVIVCREDGEEIPVEVTEKTKPQIVSTVLQKVFEEEL